MQLGLQGKVFGDWSYNFLYDFGNASTETPGHILNAYVQYDGLAPWAIRVGAFAPPHSFDDTVGSGDLLFFERTSPANLARNIAGSEGRTGLSVIYAGDRVFGALSYTGGKVQDSAVFDEQQAVVGRLLAMVYEDKDADARVLIGSNFLHVFKLPDAVAGGTASLETTAGKTQLHSITLADFPEFTVDSTAAKLVGTGALSAGHVTSFGFEAAGNWKNFYLQSGYFGYFIDRAPVTYTVYSAAGTSAAQTVRPDDDSFSGWYVQGSWILTGESKSYVKATGAFTIPKPAHPFSLTEGGWGAWEIAARYSDLDLNDHANSADNVVTAWSGSSKTYTFTNAARGGEQKIVTFGLNWYPNANVRFVLDYMWIDIDRLQAATTASSATLPALSASQTVQVIGLRSQVAF
jgi:phosphate-selective porin OprO and OprP